MQEARSESQAHDKSAAAGEPFITMRAEAVLDGSMHMCSIDTGVAMMQVGLHPRGAEHSNICSGDMILQAIVACAGATIATYADQMGIKITGGKVKAEGLIDYSGALGTVKDAPVGFQEINIDIMVVSSASEAQIDELLQVAQQHCVVLQTLFQPPKFTMSRTVLGAK